MNRSASARQGTGRPSRAPGAAGALAAASIVLLTACTGAATPESSGTESVPQVASTRERDGTTDVSTTTGKQTSVDDDLIQAAWNGDTIRAEGLIAAGGDVNYQDHTRQSAYLIATSEGYLDLLELTFEHGADISSLDSYDGTGLIRAAERGHADVVGRLLQTDIAVNHINNLGWTALHEAIVLGDGSQRYIDTVRLLVAGGADVKLAPRRISDTPPLQLALNRGQDDIARTIQAALEAEPLADPDAALLDAATSGDADRAALALAGGADIETRDAKQRTPLLLAAAKNYPSVARLLVALGANPDALDDRHDTPWLVTGVSGSVAMADILLRADPDLTILNRYGGTALIPASERGHVDYVRRVVETDID
ncbi:MAG: ankyrin repeat domain-containing protein, partial [Ilumatobacteraceae bacterium]